MTALIIESDAILRRFLCRLLERHGVDFVVAETEEHGLRLLREDASCAEVLVHGEAMARGAPDALRARVSLIAPTLPVVTYGGATRVPASNGRGPRLSAGTPFDAETLVRSIVDAVNREGANHHEGADRRSDSRSA